MRMTIIPSDFKVNIDGNVVRFFAEEWATLGIDDHIHAIQYDDALGHYEIQWCVNPLTRRQPENERHPIGEFGKYWTKEEFDTLIALHAAKVAANAAG